MSITIDISRILTFLFFAEPMYPDQSDFHYDYETLRTTGVILATVLAVSGILIAMSSQQHERNHCTPEGPRGAL
uniref:FXYD domain-containing ion transport regulator n=1 Tax=Gadus morhua TaxID=8049 RepID=A0A8C5FJV4_GADMO